MTIRGLAEGFGISIRSYHDILTENHLMTEHQKENRMEVCLKLLEQALLSRPGSLRFYTIPGIKNTIEETPF